MEMIFRVLQMGILKVLKLLMQILERYDWESLVGFFSHCIVRCARRRSSGVCGGSSSVGTHWPASGEFTAGWVPSPLHCAVCWATEQRGVWRLFFGGGSLAGFR